ncbi:helix-turn-helix transcriptional regulator [Vibrio salinus]|uniref:helix-turn-helix transcriptional regulator n=1 Tax=Vibrio salinus TaxID=2899784 RepID=UPI001E391913|nr:AraC family transcriptional regulator [Vibrio salinus]MCE0495053.1 AraC family transcriptional regulator [Vibrio salinus]
MDKIRYTTSPDCAINLIEADYHEFEFNRHYHLDFHIGLITGGAQRFYHKGFQHSVGHGEVVIMHPDELHDGRAMFDSGYQVRVFSIQPNWFNENLILTKPCDVLGFNRLIIRDSDVFLSLIQLHQKLTQPGLSQLAKDCLPYEGFANLVQNYSSVREKAVVPLGTQSLDTLKEYLLANLDQPVHLKQLAGLCDLTPTKLQRNFKARTGITPYAWLTRLRLEQGMKLIKAGISGTEVAQRVGFYDQAHFTKAFRNTYGVPPSAIN